MRSYKPDLRATYDGYSTSMLIDLAKAWAHCRHEVQIHYNVASQQDVFTHIDNGTLNTQHIELGNDFNETRDRVSQWIDAVHTEAQ